jgi:hypothetical protein
MESERGRPVHFRFHRVDIEVLVPNLDSQHYRSIAEADMQTSQDEVVEDVVGVTGVDLV